MIIMRSDGKFLRHFKEATPLAVSTFGSKIGHLTLRMILYSSSKKVGLVAHHYHHFVRANQQSSAADRFREAQVSSKHYCPNSTSSQNYQTLTLAINGNNGAPNQDCSRPTTPYTQPTNSRRTVKTNEAAINIKNNDNDFSNSLANATKALQQSTSTSDYNSIQVQNSEIIPTTPVCVRTVHLNSSSPASDYYIKVNGNRQCIQVNQSYLKQDAGSPVGGNKNEFQGSCTNSNKVVLKLGDITSDQIQR